MRQHNVWCMCVTFTSRTYTKRYAGRAKDLSAPLYDREPSVRTVEFPVTSSLPILNAAQTNQNTRRLQNHCNKGGQLFRLHTGVLATGMCDAQTMGSLNLKFVRARSNFTFRKQSSVPREVVRVMWTLICSISMRWVRRVTPPSTKVENGQIIQRNTPGTVLCCICDIEHLAMGQRIYRQSPNNKTHPTFNTTARS